MSPNSTPGIHIPKPRAKRLQLSNRSTDGDVAGGPHRRPKPFQVVVDDLLQARWGRKLHDGWWSRYEYTSRGRIDEDRMQWKRVGKRKTVCIFESSRINVKRKQLLNCEKSPQSLGKCELSVKICARKGESPERCGEATDDQHGWQVKSTHELNYRRSFGNCLPKKVRPCLSSLAVGRSPWV